MLAADPEGIIGTGERKILAALRDPRWMDTADEGASVRAAMLPVAAHYVMRATSADGRPVDPVARFHLGNGARLERLNWLADATDNGIGQSHGLMVNYLYDLDHIEQNHEAYAEGHKVVASNAVKRLVRKAASDLVPVG